MPDQENNTSLTQLDCYFIEYSIKITCIDVQMFKIPLLKKNEIMIDVGVESYAESSDSESDGRIIGDRNR
jgi:hypothetical protein